MIVKEVTDIQGIAEGVLEDIYDDSLVVSHLGRDRNKGNWSVL